MQKEQAEPEDILEGWKNYFEDLYRSHKTDNESKYNTERLILATMQNEIIEQIETNRNEEIKQANEEEVTLSIQKLKTGKSPGADGISAEHLKNMPTELLQYIINIINLIFKEKDVPSKVKEGVVTPVLKSGKDKIYPENYRGITVTNCFSTLIESILKDRIEPKLLPQQSKLQRGFTEKSSSLNAAFIVTQSADFYKEILCTLVLLTLDAQKAFDKLDHEILFNKLYHDGITGNIWILLRNMYKNVAVKINLFRDKILYKRYNNNILDALDRADIGAKIGNISVVAPTCADDIALLASNKHEIQALLDIVHDSTKRDLVTINPNKSDLVPLTTKCENFSVQLGNDIIDQKSETKHLGLVRETPKNKLNIEDRLKTARKTVYAMLGPGLHARKGMSPIVALKVWQTYAIPRCLYGIEIMNYTKTDILKLERLQQQVCRQIQGLPNRTANAATYVMLGVEPIQATVDRLVLTFFGGIIQDSASIEFMIIERQLCMSPPNSNNFINRLKEILDKYGLPKAQEIMNSKPTKEIWKRTVKKAINMHWEKQWLVEKENKTTMQYLDINQQPIGKPHQIWQLVPNTTIEVKKAEIKARLITRTYTLQSDREKFTRGRESDKCLLCETSREDTHHFLITCTALKMERDKHLSVLKSYLKHNTPVGTFDRVEEQGLLVLFILNPSATKFKELFKLKKSNCKDIEAITRTLCYSLHIKRTLLNQTKA
ncbi:Hypothetical predicted protein [Mytilus galloprovincialis]|uniref:Reverse transcriptase domain-containing protein n=1 Tax=Mytilus galloprovincialis TaxID=29158 RepID=A0A8B6G668_MYTGA|nr:Hypothetical predicted protein [Mytilus galloprovincialis]